MAHRDVVFSSLSIDWPTPKTLYTALNREFNFDFDPCPLNPDFDGLSISWAGRRVFCNPPYGRGVGKWLSKVAEADLAVFLLPARTDTLWFHTLVLPVASEIRFIQGRLCFGDKGKRATFPSMVVVYPTKEQKSHLL